jgi:hypothetical protein
MAYRVPGQCKHCGLPKNVGARNLCEACWRKRGVRRLYKPLANGHKPAGTTDGNNLTDPQDLEDQALRIHLMSILAENHLCLENYRILRPWLQRSAAR